MKTEYEVTFIDGQTVKIMERTLSRAKVAAAYGRLLIGGQTHRELAVKSGRVVLKRSKGVGNGE